MRRFAFIPALAAISLVCTSLVHAGVNDWLNILKKPTSDSIAPATANLSQSEMSGALKQALDQGVQHAVKQLGQPGGFLNDARVRIPMPGKLAWIDSTLRKIGKDELADEFINSMNHAAEQAVPEAASVFAQAIRDMTLDDARTILQGSNDSATRYFRQHSTAALTERMLPIVQRTTDGAGVTSHYKNMTDKAGGLASMLGQNPVDLDAYITDKALDGLFVMIAEQEKLIRENPLERSTELLQKVFGSLTRP